ncbi:hypothetical protein SAMN04487934_101205 [Eubacterium ruminantium]|nr:hypothetical protein SAMN04487934_101205 [Eubacterium ruminantium]
MAKKKKIDISLIMTGVQASVCFLYWIYETMKYLSTARGYKSFEMIILLVMSAVVAVFAFMGYREYTFAGVTLYFTFKSIEFINNFNYLTDEFKLGKRVTGGRDINEVKEKAYYVFDALYSVSLIILTLCLLAMTALTFFTKKRGFGTVIILISGISALLGVMTRVLNIVLTYKDAKTDSSYWRGNIIEILYILISISMIIFITVSVKEHISKKMAQNNIRKK